MFPKPMGTHRGSPGSFSGLTSAGQVYESYTGKLYVTPTIFYTNTDVDDVLNYEIFNNPTWSTSSLASIQNTTYYEGANYRFRLSNDYFGSFSPYETGIAAQETRIGGASSQIITSEDLEFNQAGNWTLAKGYHFRTRIPKELVNSLNAYDKTFEVYMSFFFGSVITISNTFASWPQDSLGSTLTSGSWEVETIAESGGGTHYLVEVRFTSPDGPPSVWYRNMINMYVKYADSAGDNAKWTTYPYIYDF